MYTHSVQYFPDIYSLALPLLFARPVQVSIIPCVIGVRFILPHDSYRDISNPFFLLIQIWYHKYLQYGTISCIYYLAAPKTPLSLYKYECYHNPLHTHTFSHVHAIEKEMIKIKTPSQRTTMRVELRKKEKRTDGRCFCLVSAVFYPLKYIIIQAAGADHGASFGKTTRLLQ